MEKPEGWQAVVTLSIPTSFWSDHSLRHQDPYWDGPSGWPVKHGSRMTVVAFAQDELDSLIDDASTMIAYAANGEYEGDAGLIALVRSAKRTLAIIEAGTK
jgi:hypothetical protein